MPQPPNGAAQGAQAQSGAASNDAGANANANASEALSPDDIRAIVAEQVRAALDPKALSSAIAPVVNAAVTNHLKRTGSQQGQQAQQGEQAQQGQQLWLSGAAGQHPAGGRRRRAAGRRPRPAAGRLPVRVRAAAGRCGGLGPQWPAK